MPDRLEKLRSLLSQLVSELHAADKLDEPTRQKLAEAASEMIAALHRGEGVSPQDAESLQDRIVEFEALHPNLAAVVNRLIEILGQMGI